MSYALAGAVQAAIYGLLTGDAGVTAVLGDAIYDAPPGGTLPATYALVGEEVVRDASDREGAGARHDVTVSVISEAAGFAAAKAAGAAICDALIGAQPALARGRVVGLWFVRGKARRVSPGDLRRIDLRFRARTEDE